MKSKAQEIFQLAPTLHPDAITRLVGAIASERAETASLDDLGNVSSTTLLAAVGAASTHLLGWRWAMPACATLTSAWGHPVIPYSCRRLWATATTVVRRARGSTW